MKGRIYNYLGIGFALTMVFISFQAGAQVQPKETPELLSLGKMVYKQQCAVCHGAEGKGDGDSADYLFPRPWDITSGKFKIRSTPTGQLPTEGDLFKTITNGIPGSAMPSWKFLAEKERWALLYYIKSLDERFKTWPRKAISKGTPPAFTLQLLAKGKQVYDDMECAKCHGLSGRGDGPSANELTDDFGYPAPPNDFTRGIYKGGGERGDIYLRFTTGMSGTPMPSYEESLNEEERWALVYFVKALAGPKVAVQPSAGTIVAKRVSGPLPQVALDPRWDKIPATTIPLMLLWQRNTEAADELSVRAMHNEREIAFLLEWGDWQESTRSRRDIDFTDAAAIMFSLSPQLPLSKQAHFAMGEKGKPVNIWYWGLDRQMNLVGGRPSAIAEDLNAEGFGTVTAQSRPDQNVNGYGLYAAGRWRVIFTRQLRSKGQLDAQLKLGSTVPVAFAVWNGSQEDRDGQKAVSTWYKLELRR